MQAQVSAASKLQATITVPGDKSISHRALMLGAIARGRTTVHNLSPSDDCGSTRRCLEQLGIEFTTLDQPLVAKEDRPWGDAHAFYTDYLLPSTSVAIEGRGLRGLTEAANVLDAGNSGTTTRLLAGILAGQPFCSILTGDESLRARPMDRVLQPLMLMGARAIGRGGDRLLPLAIRGGDLKATSYQPPVASAQVKSAVLLAGLYAEGETVLEERQATRDHTERMLRAMGARLDIAGNRIAIQGFQELDGIEIVVPGDASSAAFFLIAAAITPQAEITVANVGMNAARQGFADVLHAMGAELEVHDEREVNGEPIADLTCRTSALHGITIEGSTIPTVIDELPILAVAATQAAGVTIVRNAEELRVKESDRIATTVAELKRLGAKIEATPDGFVIEGPTRLQGARCQSYHDHRIAMAVAIAALAAKGETTIDGAECVDISFPGFFELLHNIRKEA